MRRSVVTTTVILALAVAPAAAFAQTPPAGQPPAGQPPAGQPPAGGAPPAAAAPAAPKEPRMALTGASGAFMFVIKADQTTAFEELVGKVKSAMMASDNPVRKQQAAGWRVFKAAEPSGANALYLCLADPAIPAAEYDPLVILSESFGTDAGKPENQEMLKKYAAVFANVSRLNLTPVTK